MKHFLSGNSHEEMFTPTEHNYLAIGFADLRFYLTIKNKI